jgi:sensor c-di-GMP phosphodiesterase-like protein
MTKYKTIINVDIQKEYEECKEKIEYRSRAQNVSDILAPDHVTKDAKVALSTDLNTFPESHKNPSEDITVAQSNMKVSAGISKSGIELKLREVEESMTHSIISNQSDFISRWRSIDHSSDTNFSFNITQGPDTESNSESLHNRDVSKNSQSNTSGLCISHEIMNNFYHKNGDDESKSCNSSVCPEQGSTSSCSAYKEYDESWRSTSTSTDFSRIKESSHNHGNSEVVLRDPTSSYQTVPHVAFSRSSKVDGETSLDSHIMSHDASDDITQASV